jgi:hypothetical protein
MPASATLEELFVPAEGRTKIFNPFFEEWNDRILTTLRGSVSTGRKSYEKNGDKSLLHEAMFHSELFARPLTSTNVLILMHPSYIFISGYADLIDAHKHDAAFYSSNLAELLDRRSNLDLNVVFYDSLYSYCDESSVLLEKGLIDRVFFTEHGSGLPRDMSDFSYFNGKKPYFAGMFNEHCLSSTMWRFMNNVCYEGSVKAVSDLVLEYPDSGSTSLKPTKIVSRSGYNIKSEYLPSEDVLTLKQFYTLVTKK